MRSIWKTWKSAPSFCPIDYLCQKNNCTVWMPGFYDYWHFFPKLYHRPIFGTSFYPFSIFSPENLFYTFNFIFRKANQLRSNLLLFNLVYIDSSSINPWDSILKSKQKVILFGGFIFHEFMLDCESALPEINQIFTPDSLYSKKINHPINFLKSRCDLICGVLIRQTDYRSWNEGKYFFESEEYFKILITVKEKIKKLKIGFFIATDEDQYVNDSYDIDCLIRVGHPIENLYSLSLCDFLIGPPSSYISWASLYGDRPLYTIFESSNYHKMLYSFLDKKVLK